MGASERSDWPMFVMGATPDARSEGGFAWGLLTGLVIGGSLGPVFAGVAGLAAEYFLGGSGYLVRALLFGVFAGPFLGVIGWEAAYWVADIFRTRETAAH